MAASDTSDTSSGYRRHARARVTVDMGETVTSVTPARLIRGNVHDINDC